MLFRCLGRIELQILCIVHHDVPVETRGDGPEIVGRDGNAIDKPDRGLDPGITTISIPNAEGVRICVPDLPPVLVPFVKLDPRAYCPYLM
jgi:hypothetical protein